MASGGRTEDIRFGILCSGRVLPSWQTRCLEKLLELEGVTFALLIDTGVPSTSFMGGRFRRRMSSRSAAWWAYERVAMRRSGASRGVDVSTLVSGVPTIECRVARRDAHVSYFSEDDVARIRGCDLDFILSFDPDEPQGRILSAARLGVWAFGHGGVQAYAGRPPCFWETYHGDAITRATLERLTESADGGIVLREGFLRTHPYSYIRGRDSLLLSITDWPALVCRDLRAGTAAYVGSTPSTGASFLTRHPTTWQIVRAVLRQWVNFGRLRLAGLLWRTQWNVGVVDHPIHSFLELVRHPHVSWLPEPPRDRYLADPFGLVSNGRYYVLLEDFDQRRGSGQIVALEGLGTGPGPSRSATIPLATHASYPFLFEDGGAAYCIPETADANEAVLLRADGWPDEWPPKRWVKAATLIQGFPIVDPTVVPFGGTWWLFCGNLRDEPNAKLWVWHAPTLFGPWRPHMGNPVKTDIRSARPGGTPFVWEGKLYRPAQDNSLTYGGRVVINHVTKLTATEFSERVAARVDPFAESPFPLGLHTCSALGDKTLIDGKRRVLTSYPVLSREVRALAKTIGLTR